MTTVKELKAQAKARGIKGFSTMKKADLEKALGGSAKAPKKMTKKQQVDKAFEEIEAKIDKSPRARDQRERLSDIWGYNIYSGNLKKMIMKRLRNDMKPMAGGIMNTLEVLGLELANNIMIREDNAGYEDLTPAEKKKSVALKKRVAKKTA